MDISVFVRADSTNLPKVENLMILEYMSANEKHNIAEIRGAKVLMSSRDSYIDTAVGFVEVSRTTDKCIVQAKVVPEHRIGNKTYSVRASINEKENTITATSCDGCAASAGGCKHTLVFLFWLSKKSGEPASTSVECYWKKPKLTSARIQPLPAKDIFKKSKKVKVSPKDTNVLRKFQEECVTNNIRDSLVMSFSMRRTSYNLFDMILEFSEIENDHSFQNLKECLDRKITQSVVEEIQNETKKQVHSKMWHNVRQGRITASIIHAVCRCQTDGSLVQQILGGYKVPETLAIKRGQMLEKKVIKELEKIIGKSIENCGFFLINSLIGASPDGLNDDFIVEVKCPSKEETVKHYVENNKVKSKFIAQMQMQMLATGKEKAVFCVADPSFELNKKIQVYWIDFDANLANEYKNKATKFWETYLFPKFMKSVKC